MVLVIKTVQKILITDGFQIHYWLVYQNQQTNKKTEMTCKRPLHPWKTDNRKFELIFEFSGQIRGENTLEQLSKPWFFTDFENPSLIKCPKKKTDKNLLRANIALKKKRNFGPKGSILHWDWAQGFILAFHYISRMPWSCSSGLQTYSW